MVLDLAMVFAVLSAAVVLALAGLSAYFLSRPAKLPGTLEPTGEFELDAPDLADAPTRDERARDFARLCRARGALLYASVAAGGAVAVEAVALTGGEGEGEGEGAAFDAFAAQIGERYGADVRAGGAYALLAATPPFEFATRFGFPPLFPEARYALVRDGQGALRVAWASCCVDKPPAAAPPRVFPFFVAFVSEPLLAAPRDATRVAFRYACAPNSSADLDGTFAKWLADEARAGRL